MPTRIIFLNRFFYPDHSATSQMLGDLAFHLAAQGAQIHVIASRQRYDEPEALLAARESVRGVAVHRVATARFGRRWLPGRVLDYLSFYVSAGWRLLRLARRGDVVVAKTDPPMLSVLVAALGRVRGFRTVNWLQDLYPELAVELGVMAAKGRTGRGLAALRNGSLRGAAMNVAIGEDMAKRLRGLGVPPDKIRVIHNWSDDAGIVPSGDAADSLRRDWALEGKFVVAYSGNLGRAHDVETILGAAERLKARTDIVFLFIGGGHGATALGAEARKRGLAQIVFQPYQPREMLARSLAVADLHWLSLKANLDGLILPSKFYGIAAAGRPVVVIGSPEAELARLVAQGDCGAAVELGRSEELAGLILSLAQDPVRCGRMGMNARRMLEARFTRGQAFERWRTLLQAVAAGPPAG